MMVASAAHRQPDAITSAISHDGETPLLRAAYNSHTDVVSALLAAGADVHAITDKREGVMHWWAIGVAYKSAATDAMRATAAALLGFTVPVVLVAERGRLTRRARR